MEKDGYEHVTLKMTIREYLELQHSLRESDYLSVPWQYFINVRGAITMQDALMEHYFLRVAEHGPYTPVFWNGRWSERHYAYFCMFNTRNNQGDCLTGLQRRCVKGLKKQLDMLGWGCTDWDPTYANVDSHRLPIFKERLPQGPARLYVYAVCYNNWVKKTKEIRQLLFQEDEAFKRLEMRSPFHLHHTSIPVNNQQCDRLKWFRPKVTTETDEQEVLYILTHRARHYLTQWEAGEEDTVL